MATKKLGRSLLLEVDLPLSDSVLRKRVRDGLPILLAKPAAKKPRR